jgi:glycerophosphoryl diester phosphodiesterase
MLNLSARDLVIVAHRGANHLAPENTIAATEKCIELGVAYVEIDVRTSKDGVFYILHDKTLDRTTNGTGAIAERNSEYIDNLDAGSWFSPDFAGQHVPKLKPYLERFKGKIKVYFDVKGADLSKLVKLAIDPDIPLKMNAIDVPGLKRVLDYNPQIIEYRLDHLTPSFVAFCRDHKLKLMAHALHKGAESDYQRIIDSAADMVNLDKADVMIELLKE